MRVFALVVALLVFALGIALDSRFLLDSSRPGTAAAGPPLRDLLDDLVEVLGSERVPAADVPARCETSRPTTRPIGG